MAAHRGAGKLAPENTMAAMRLGASFGYRMVEFDVKLSADDVLFLLHDDTVDRTSNGVGRAADLSWHGISQFDAGAWHSHHFVGETMPTFTAVMAFCQGNAIAVNAEIKPSAGRERETGAAVARAVARSWANAEPLPLLSSFSEIALDAAREAAPHLPRALLLDKLPEDWLARCQRLGCIALDSNWRALTPEIVATAHAHGLAVMCYTCNDEAAVRALIKMGVNTIITDAIAEIAP